MPASRVNIQVEGGVKNLHCPACAAPVFTDDRGVADDLCDHVCFFIDWAGEITLASPDNYGGADRERQTALVELVDETEDWDEFIERAAKALPRSALVLDLDVPEGEEDEDGGSRAVVAFDLAAGPATA